MNIDERKNHWENVFQTKDTTQVSWYQPKPETSLKLIEELKVEKNAPIIEIGSGDSFLADYLLLEGYENITLLDISETALEKIRKRLGNNDSGITFIADDVTNFKQKGVYHLWHDRAVFHFLSDKNDIRKYVSVASEKIVAGGYLIIGTFSISGPGMCSGLNVQRYGKESLTEIFSSAFKRVKCFDENHITPSGSVQNFIFCIFQKT